MSVGKRFSWHSLILIAALSPTLQAATEAKIIGQHCRAGVYRRGE